MVDNSQETRNSENITNAPGQLEKRLPQVESADKIQELESQILHLKEQSKETQASALKEVEALESANYIQEEVQYSQLEKQQSAQPLPTTPTPLAVNLKKLSIKDLRTKNPQDQAQLLITYAAQDLKQTVKALGMAIKLDNPYVIDALHDALVKNKV